MPQSPLAAPSGQLKYVVLGLGTQNYTCATGHESTVPRATGAVATLYDIGSRLNGNVIAAISKIPFLSGRALLLSQYPKALKAYLRLEGYDHVIGHHFFDGSHGTSMPVFAFDQLPWSPYPTAQVGKVDETNPPASAYAGLQQEGAVSWLYLTDTGLSVGGIDTVYRLETAGGKSPVSCKDRRGSFEVKYAAQYWVFGPSDDSVASV
ncbi:malate dehydrogenase protein [Stemphylium lycopersici]|uniref:Malate dehydrogenase protein n=1 Tax=Stemphylium lycopersici TaxID=183478 RepID=A0A364MTM2_STELY|nr:hypothetical protein TW65_09319 [Stemphylium lycopersici]RAQ98871.1 malate dehydrogenase protein [Stemphylium lycopersici]RAR02285.1 malate dehydrogenase protein [Stemphylium lycopersici]